MSNKLNRVYGLDILKFFCVFFVIMIHAPFPGKVGGCLVALSRIAVPIFFMITGYFYIDVQNRNRELKQIKKIFFLCLFSNILYFLWGIFLGLFNGDNISSFLVQTFNQKSLFKFIVFNESPVAGHLWYLGSILYVLIIVYFLEKLFPKHSSKILLILTPFLLLLDLLFGKYSLVLLHREYPYIIVRNFLCVGLPYFTIGFYLRKHRNITTIFSSKYILCILLILVFAITTIIEKYLLESCGLSASREHYISTTFLSILVFSTFINQQRYGKIQFLYKVGKEYSTYIYIIHPILIAVLSKIAKRLLIYDFYILCQPIVVYFVSVLISILFVKFKSILGGRFCKQIATKE